MKIEIEHPATDGLSRQLWVFDTRDCGMVLWEYLEQTRPSTRHKFRGGRWDRSDERRYHSSLPRPTSIPDWVVAEAAWVMRERPISVFIGSYDPESRYGDDV